MVYGYFSLVVQYFPVTFSYITKSRHARRRITKLIRIKRTKRHMRTAGISRWASQVALFHNKDILLCISIFYSIQWSNKRAVKALIRLRKCAVWSELSLSAHDTNIHFLIAQLISQKRKPELACAPWAELLLFFYRSFGYSAICQRHAKILDRQLG